MAAQSEQKQIVVSGSSSGAPRKLAVPSSEKVLDVRSKVGKDKLDAKPPTPDILKALMEPEINDLDLSGYDLRQVPLVDKVFNDCKLGAVVYEFQRCICDNCDLSGFVAMQPDGKPGGVLDDSAWRSCFLSDESRPPDITSSTVDGFQILESKVPVLIARKVHGEDHHVRKSDINHSHYEDAFLPWLDVSDQTTCNHASFARLKTVDRTVEELLAMNKEQVAKLTGGPTFDTVTMDFASLEAAVAPNAGLHITRGFNINMSDTQFPNSTGYRFDWRHVITSEKTNVAFCRFLEGVMKFEEGAHPFVHCHNQGLEISIPDKSLPPQREASWKNKQLHDLSRKGLDETGLGISLSS